MCSVFKTAWLTDGRLKDASTVTSQQNMQNIRLTFLHRTICEKQQNFLWNEMMADWKMHLQFTSPLGQNRQNKQDIRLTFLHTVHREICEKTNKTLDRHQSVTVPKCFSGTGSGTYFRNRIIFRYWFLSLFSVQKFLVPIPVFIFGTKFSQYRFQFLFSVPTFPVPVSVPPKKKQKIPWNGMSHSDRHSVEWYVISTPPR